MNVLKIHQVHYGAVVRITGEDAATYLQSQFSNDLQRGIDRPVTYGLLLDRKGKIQADAFILQLDSESFLAVSYRCSADDVLAKLEENIIADDVELEDVTSQFEGFVFWGDAVDAAAEKLVNASVTSGVYAHFESSFMWHGRHTSRPNIDWLIPKGQKNFKIISALLQSCGIDCEWADFVELERERVKSLMPCVPLDLGPNELPQEGGLEVSAVSFEKGCYLGQEVMARLHAMGKVQRSLVKIKSNKQLDTSPIILFLEERAVGEIRSIAIDGSGCMGLALVKNRYVKPGIVLALEPNGIPEIEVEP